MILRLIRCREKTVRGKAARTDSTIWSTWAAFPSRGLDTRLLFKSVNPATVHLLGTGFKKNDSVTVQMMMNNNGTHGLTYDVKAEFKDENTFNLTIPPLSGLRRL